MKTLSEAYIMGINEGRDTLRHFPDLCPKTEAQGCARLMSSHSYIMRQFFKGQHEFWKNQIKKN